MQIIRAWLYAAALSLLFAGYVHATTYDVTFDSNGFFELKSDKLAAGSFADTFRFSLSAPGAVTLSLSFKDNAHILSTLSLYENGVLDYGPISYAATGRPLEQAFSLDGGKEYEIRLTGTTDKNGRYAIQLTQAAVVAPPPVPEPAEWSMLVAGFIVIGFIARRRKRNFS